MMIDIFFQVHVSLTTLGFGVILIRADDTSSTCVLNCHSFAVKSDQSCDMS